jgi:hypothetical protein
MKCRWSGKGHAADMAFAWREAATLDRDAFTFVHASRSSRCCVARFTLFGDHTFQAIAL